MITTTIILALCYLVFRGFRNARRMKRNYDSIMFKVTKGDRIVYFQGDSMQSGDVMHVLPDVVQVLTDDKHLIYIERSKIACVCLN
jgi:preprotein translocase subunit YajC